MSIILEDFESSALKLPWTGSGFSSSYWHRMKDVFHLGNYSLGTTMSNNSHGSYYQTSISVNTNYISFYYKIYSTYDYFEFDVDGNNKISVLSTYGTWNFFKINLDKSNHTFIFRIRNKSSNSYGGSFSSNIDDIQVGQGYYFLQDGNNLCKSDDGIQLITSDSLPYTKDKFINYGMNELSNINPTVINKINNQKYNIALLK